MKHNACSIFGYQSPDMICGGNEKDDKDTLVVGRLPEKPKNRPKIPKPEPNRNRKLQIFQKPNRTETEFKNRG